MIEGLDKVLDGSGQPGLHELRDLLGELLDGPSVDGSFIEHQNLQRRSMRVFRLRGGDLGVHFVESNVRDAIYALEACQESPPRQELRDRLLRRLYTIRSELPQREEVLKKWGGPETLLHGDLWTINVFVMQSANGLRACLIDWDHAAVGPFTYV